MNERDAGEPGAQIDNFLLAMAAFDQKMIASMDKFVLSQLTQPYGAALAYFWAFENRFIGKLMSNKDNPLLGQQD